MILGRYSGTETKGSSFCEQCGTPAAWLSRTELMDWIRNLLQTAGDIAPSTRLELREVLERLQGMEPDDTRTIPGWERVKTAAPRVWETIKPVMQTVAGEAVKRALGL